MSSRSLGIRYAIRDLAVAAKEVESQGKEVTFCNIGDPLKYDFKTPELLKDSLTNAVQDEKNFYSDSQGVQPLREAICEREKSMWNINLSPESVLVTSGVSEGISLLGGAFSPGDEILLPGPHYPSYTGYFSFLGLLPKEYKLIEEESWSPDLNDLRNKVTEKAKAIVVINPNNPCGNVISEKKVRELCDIAGEHDLLVISDEIYDLIYFDRKPVAPASLAEDVPILCFNGISKTLLATGWRLGWVYYRDVEGKWLDLWEGMVKQTRLRLCANTPVQFAVAEVLSSPECYKHVPDVLEKLRKRRDYFVKRINEIEGISTATSPEGAFYIFPNLDLQGLGFSTDKDFVLNLLQETGVLFVHGSGFGKNGSGHFRSVLLPPLSTLERALELVESFVKNRLN